MSEHYIQTQYLIKQITNDFFDGKSDTIRVKENLYDVDMDDVSVNSDVSEESLEKMAPRNDEKYYYLDSDKEISTIFDICDNKSDILEKFNVFVCLYSINYEGFYPFLEYNLVQEENELNFPSFEFQCANNILSSQGELTSKDVYFQNECMKTLLKYATPIQNADLDDSYKGFVQEGNQIYVIYDLGFFTGKDELKKTTIFEILNTQKTLDKLISKNVNNLFTTTPSLINIKDSENKLVQTPRVLYRYKIEDGKHFNEMNEDDEFISLIDKPSETFLFGENNYLFTSTPISEKNIDKLKRYAVFIENPIYSTNVFQEKINDESFTLGKVIPNMVDYFSKDDEKKPDIKEEDEEETEEDDDETEEDEEDDDETEEDEEDDDETEEDEEDEEDDDETEEDEEETDEYKLLKLSKDNGSIYYHEVIDEKNMPIWLIKSSRHFIEL